MRHKHNVLEAFSTVSFCLLIASAMTCAMLAAGPLSAQSASPQAASRQTVSGAELYQQRCAQCHENASATRAPLRDTLQKMPASRILRTLDFDDGGGLPIDSRRAQRSGKLSGHQRA